MPAESPTDWAVQDWLVVVEGLAEQFDPAAESRTARRGWRLLETICESCEIESTEYVFAIDNDWGPAAAAAAGSEAQPDSQPAEAFDAEDWQLVADAAAVIADRDNEGARGERAAALAEAAANYESSVSPRPASDS